MICYRDQLLTIEILLPLFKVRFGVKYLSGGYVKLSIVSR